MSDTPDQTIEQTPHAAPGASTAPGDASAPTAATADAHAPTTASKDTIPTEPADSVQDGEALNDETEIEGDLDELLAVTAKRDEYLALAQRTQADFENYRKRVARESALAQDRGISKLAKELLPALDNLDRALDAADQDDPLLQGVRLVRSEFADALARLGVESFSPAGEIFDPSIHEAMATAPQPADGPASGTVVEVYQPGYRLGEQIIRPARVVVAA